MGASAASRFAACTFIWGSTWLAIKLGLDGVPPFLGAGLRFVLAAAALWLAVLLGRRPVRLSAEGRKAALSAALIGFFWNYALVYWSETRLPSGLVAVVFSLSPVLTALSAYALGAERPGSRYWAGALVGAAGVGVLAWPAEGAAGADPWGLLAALLACSGASVNIVLQARWARREDSVSLNAWAMSGGALLLLALSLLLERGLSPAWTPKNAAALAYLALAGSVAAFLLFYSLLKELPPSRVSLMTLLFPAVALALGWAALGEAVGWRGLFGSVLILGGVSAALFAGAGGATPRRAA